ncbi:MAG: hypothetical protein HUK21_07015 [Fibrobacteraceae bacterium]|nr:hypothetical protein [Fibrobacteraceae bacterium]
MTAPKKQDKTEYLKYGSLFKKLTAIPYLFVFLSFLLPLMTVSCTEDKVVASPSFYSVASGVDLETTLQEPALSFMHNMEKGNPKAMEKFKVSMPGFPKLEPMPVMYGVLAAVFLAAAFAVFSPIGSLCMGLLSLIMLWNILSQLSSALASSFGLPMLDVNAGVGLYAASALIIIGSAMNLTSIIRPIVGEFKSKKKTENSVSSS